MPRFPLRLFVAVLLVCVGCDHATKQAAGWLLSDAPVLTFAGDTLRFELASNPGAFLNLGEGLPDLLRHLLLLGGVPLLLAIVCWYFLRSAQATPGELAALALVAGGGLGNWLDRLLHEGRVTDFVSIGFGPVRTGIFNLADVLVLAGVCTLLLLAQRRSRVP
jgi:signal peptidase II